MDGTTGSPGNVSGRPNLSRAGNKFNPDTGKGPKRAEPIQVGKDSQSMLFDEGMDDNDMHNTVEPGYEDENKGGLPKNAGMWNSGGRNPSKVFP